MIPIGQLDPSVFLTAHGWVQLLTLTTLEIVLGIDNIVVISILSGELPRHQQRKGRRMGLALAMITRVLLLLTISWLARLVTPLFSIGGWPVNGRGLVLMIGGAYLIYKAGTELYQTVELIDHREGRRRKTASFWSVVLQIILIDIVFSLDSVITAVGMSNEILIMVLAIIIAVLIMLLASDVVSEFVDRHATVKVLALAFLVIVGIALIIEGSGLIDPQDHRIKNMVYAAMGFSVLVEVLDQRMQRNIRRSQDE